jgi:hypothetical protein
MPMASAPDAGEAGGVPRPARRTGPLGQVVAGRTVSSCACILVHPVVLSTGKALIGSVTQRRPITLTGTEVAPPRTGSGSEPSGWD